MKWSTVFEQVAARPESLAEIARLNGTTPDEILAQVKLQVTCAGANQDAARRAGDALSRRATTETESEERKKLEEEIRKQLEDKAKEKAEEMAKEAWEKQLEQSRQQAQQQDRIRQQQAQQQERARQLQEQAQRQQQAQQQALQQERLRQMRDQAQRDQAQRDLAQQQERARQQQEAQRQQQQARRRTGCSRGARWLLGAVAAVTAILSLYVVAKQAFPTSNPDIGGRPQVGVTPTCPPQVSERRKCPWSPDGYTVEPCPPGFCYDAGPQGSLACKQENAVENSHQNDLSTLVCNDGYYPEYDPCTGVILRCVKQ